MTHMDPPRVDATQEVRFAVVMYGGISLAIYINGVAQELLKLVRATAPSSASDANPRTVCPESELSATERVYRKLGQMLVRGENARNPDDVQSGDTIRTRFVVDILSGSSAGGINAVYLAKALANDQPLALLKNLWIEQGDIGLLINDSDSTTGTKLAKQDPPRSLLSSQRMYWKLLEALDHMDSPDPEAGEGLPPSAERERLELAEELDLFVTATDMQGQVIKLRLADKIVRELRHRNVFRFRYSSSEHDFCPDSNPFLAYAARCTSAHPAAFEPMKLGDIDDVLDRHPDYVLSPGLRAKHSGWRRFYEEYLRPMYDSGEEQGSNLFQQERRVLEGALSEQERKKLAEKFLKRDFNDGGVLDNAPFRHATDAIPLHRARVPVDRKLMYIEPAPDRPELRPEVKRSPNIMENAWLSLSTLPRYETIREDLQRVLERNRLIERVNSIIEGHERDVMERGIANNSTPSQVPGFSDEEWDKQTLIDMIRAPGRGSAWGGYHRLRVAETTDNLALLIARVAGVADESDEFQAIRHLVRSWRIQHYDPYMLDGKRSENEFLRCFDLMWYLRRLKFVLTKIDEMSKFSKLGLEFIHYATQYHPGDNKEKMLFQSELLTIKARLDNINTEVLAARAHLWKDREDHPLGDYITSLGITAADLNNLLKPQTQAQLDNQIQQIFHRKQSEFEEFGNQLQGCLDSIITGAREQGDELVRRWPGPLPRPEDAARRAVQYYYEHFDVYDVISYPILYAAGVGEELDMVEVFRVSPKDSPALIPETLARPKLAGTRLNNFGAFFEEKFRRNDILWGQLDGAERIITALLPNEEDVENRKALIKEAHRAIIAEEVFVRGANFQDEVALRGLLDEIISYTRAGAEDQTETLLSDLADRLGSSSLGEKLQPPLRAYLKGKDPLDYFKDEYTDNYDAQRTIEPQRMVRNAGRASKVFGKLLEGYAETQRLGKERVVWVTRLAQLFWSLVEVAVPGSVPNLIFRHWLKLLYFFEALMILLGTLSLNPEIQQFGLVAFVVTVVAHAIVLFLGDRMSGEGDSMSGERDRMSREKRRLRRERLRKVGIAALVLLVVPVLALGITLIAAMLGAEAPWRFIELLASPQGEEVRRLRGFAMVAVVSVFFLVAIREDIKHSVKRLRERLTGWRRTERS